MSIILTIYSEYERTFKMGALRAGHSWRSINRSHLQGTSSIQLWPLSRLVLIIRLVGDCALLSRK